MQLHGQLMVSAWIFGLVAVAADPAWLDPNASLAEFRAGLLAHRRYDPERRPHHASATQETVSGEYKVFDIDVDMFKERVSLHLLIDLQWTDARLEYNGTADAHAIANGVRFPYYTVDDACSATRGCAALSSNAVNDIDRGVWTPRLMFENALGAPTLSQASLTLFPSGAVVWSRYMRIEFGCEFDLALLPFDIQQCGLDLVPAHAGDAQTLSLAVAQTINTGVKEYSGGAEYRPFFAASSTGEEYICMQRNTSFWLVQVMVQMVVFFVLSYTSLWVAPSPGRVTLAVLPVLMVVNKLSTIASLIPHTVRSVLHFFCCSILLFAHLFFCLHTRSASRGSISTSFLISSPLRCRWSSLR
jgi:hypothetical protein